MPKPPARAKGGRRLTITSALKANVRHRYEHTDEPLAPMAADLGCSIETVRNLAKREGWKRFTPPPRDLSPAARLRERAEALSLYPPTELGPARVRQIDDGRNRVNPISAEGEGREAERSEDERGGVTQERSSPPPGAFGADLPPPGGGEAREQGGGDKKEAEGVEESAAAAAALHAAATAQLLHEAAGFLDDVRAARKRMKREGYAKHELQAVSRTIADLASSLARLKPIAQRAAAPAGGSAQENETAYDDMPADLDEFRNDLARRIEAFLASRPDAGVDACAADAGTADAAP